MTNLSRLTAMAGMKEWDKQITFIGRSLPEASNRYAEMFHNMNEESAGKLLNSRKFQNADLETKQVLFKEELSRNSKMIKDYMMIDLRPGDHRLVAAANITNRYSDSVIRKQIEELGFGDTDLLDLDIDEIYLIDAYLGARKDILQTR